MDIGVVGVGGIIILPTKLVFEQALRSRGIFVIAA